LIDANTAPKEIRPLVKGEVYLIRDCRGNCGLIRYVNRAIDVYDYFTYEEVVQTIKVAIMVV